jgi:ABC-type molybdate transport system permease subunit
MALDINGLIEAAHTVAKPYIMQGLKKGIEKIDETVAQSGTVADNLLWQDIKESFQIPQ